MPLAAERLQEMTEYSLKFVESIFDPRSKQNRLKTREIRRFLDTCLLENDYTREAQTALKQTRLVYHVLSRTLLALKR